VIGSMLAHDNAIDRVGSGGTVDVYLAEETRLHRRVRGSMAA
jgi:hypothetical protein